jgi:hypothetical protein
MTTKILIEFDPKDASPLEVISTLDSMMQSNLAEGKVNDYSLSLQIEDEQNAVFQHLLVAKAQQEEPKQENPT